MSLYSRTHYQQNKIYLKIDWNDGISFENDKSLDILFCIGDPINCMTSTFSKYHCKTFLWGYFKNRVYATEFRDVAYFLHQ